MSVWDFIQYPSSNQSRHSSFYSFRFRVEGIENLLQTTNNLELDTHATLLWTASHLAPVTWPVNTCRRKWLLPPRALCYRKAMITVFLWHYILWEERGLFQINLWSVKSARNMPHCPYMPLHTHLQNPFEGLSGQDDVPGSRVRLPALATSIQNHGINFRSQRGLPCGEAWKDSTKCHDSVGGLHQWHFSPPEVSPGPGHMGFSKTNQVLFFYKNLISHYWSLCRAIASFSSSFVLMQCLSIVNWSHLIQGFHIPRDFVTITQCVRPWLKLFFLRGLWIHIYFAALQLSHNSTMRLSFKVRLLGWHLVLYSVITTTHNYETGFVFFFFSEIYKLYLKLRAIYTHHV